MSGISEVRSAQEPLLNRALFQRVTGGASISMERFWAERIQFPGHVNAFEVKRATCRTRDLREFPLCPQKTFCELGMASIPWAGQIIITNTIAGAVK